MNKYESVIILKSDLSKNKLDEITSTIDKLIEKYSIKIEKQDLGIKKLAYEIKKNKEGHYYMYQFEIKENLNKDAISEIEKNYRMTDEILKFITVNVSRRYDINE